MNYKLKRVSQLYFEKGIAMGNTIQAILNKYELRINYVMPSSIQFVPWPVRNPHITENLDGFISWNSMTDSIVVKYVLHRENSARYNRCLKWYLLKLNQLYQKDFRNSHAYFIYPTENSTDIILQAQCTLVEANEEKKIRMLLFQLNAIIDEEGDNILSILSGDIPAEFKKELLEEISIIFSEMNCRS